MPNRSALSGVRQATVPPAQNGTPRCRFCGALLRHTFVDLGVSPLCESYLSADDLDEMEPFYPLHVRLCEECLLVQLEAYVSPDEIFSEYAYFSSYSDTWVEHARTYADTMIERFGLTAESFVAEIASNDGYLLRHFAARGIPVLGVEPARNVAEAARKLGIDTLVAYFGRKTAGELVRAGRSADLIAANNVLAQVPDVNDFVAGLAELLAPGGVLTIEFPHLVRLIEERQFDTIYHEHFSYFSFTTARRLLAAHSLRVFDVEELPTHGGSLRVYAQRAEEPPRPESDRVEELATREDELGYTSVEAYTHFQAEVEETKRDLLDFLVDAKRDGLAIVGYGAPGKGNTLLNYCGIRTDFLEYTVDRNPYKQGRYLPGTRIPILHPDRIAETRPDVILILPWNLRSEIVSQLSYARGWGARFVVPIPRVEVLT